MKKSIRRTDMQGLAMFISDIKTSKCKDDEIKIVNKELSKIRCQFGSEILLDGYQKKKYICKLVYIFLLGYDFDFGHNIAINLLNASKFSEKAIGYMFVSVVMNEKSNLMLLVKKALENELTQYNNPEHQILALNYIANMGSKDIADSLGTTVLRLLFAGYAPDTVKQSAILCLLKLFRVKKEVIPENEYPDRIIQFLTYPDLGVVTAATSLIEELVQVHNIDSKMCLSLTISRLEKIVKANSNDYADYSFYYVSAPWLTIKLLRLLRQFSFPTDVALKICLVEAIEIIFDKVHEPPKTKKKEHSNCKYAVMFEAISLVYHMNMESDLQITACNILEVCLMRSEPNIRNLVLESMILLSESEICQKRLKEQLKAVIDFMYSEKDMCIKRKLIDLLGMLCDVNNVKQILEEMVYYMEKHTSLRKETALKICILAEQYLQDRTLYIDVILHILREAGDYVSEAVWYRLTQIITNEDALQAYAAKAAFQALTNRFCHEKLVKAAGYILGEFGNCIAGTTEFSPIAQLRLLHSHYHHNSNETKTTLLTTYMKFVNLYPNIHVEVHKIFKENTYHYNSEIQQRAVEYLKLCQKRYKETIIKVFEKMPAAKKETLVEEALLIKNTIKTPPNMTKRTSAGKSLADQCREGKYELKKRISISNISSGATIPSVGLQNVFSSPTKEKFYCLNTVGTTTTQEALRFIIWHESGVLYENNILRLYAETEFKYYRGQVRLIYTNKTSEVLANFKTVFPEEHFDKIKLNVRPCASILQPHEIIQQEFTAECQRDFSLNLSLSLSYTVLNFKESITIFLPLTLNKFISPITMTREEFFSRWQRCQYETVKSFTAQHIIERGLMENKIRGIGLMSLENIDVKRANIVASGIFHSKLTRVGILLRLEPDYMTSSYQLTVRSTSETVSNAIAELVKMIL